MKISAGPGTLDPRPVNLINSYRSFDCHPNTTQECLRVVYVTAETKQQRCYIDCNSAILDHASFFYMVSWNWKVRVFVSFSAAARRPTEIRTRTLLLGDIPFREENFVVYSMRTSMPKLTYDRKNCELSSPISVTQGEMNKQHIGLQRTIC